MTTNRLTVLLALLLLGLSTVFFLPKHLSFQPAGIELQLPQSIGSWWGQDLAVSQKEIDVLGVGTEFSRKNYVNGRGDEIQLSIVLGGQDMNTSIHRPERCLPAQGWTITDKRSRIIDVPGYGSISATRLSNLQSDLGADQKLVQHRNLYYYWFVGHTNVTGSHFERTVIDLRDRLLKGYNQRWAYITVSAVITKERTRFGRDERETDELIEGFIGQIVPKIQKDSVERG